VQVVGEAAGVDATMLVVMQVAATAKILAYVPTMIVVVYMEKSDVTHYLKRTMVTYQYSYFIMK
jgi:hypothetical protein